MRITAVLRFPQKKKWLESYSWHRWRKQAIPSTGMTSKLRKAGITVEDANEFVKPDNPLFLDLDAIPKPLPVFPEPPVLDSSHPDWHDEPVKRFDEDTFPFEGVKQAQQLCRCVEIKKGLPDSIIEAGHAAKIEYQDLLVQRIIKQAFLWDAYTDKLPHLRDLDIPQFKFGRQYGIPLKKRNETLFRNFIRLCDSKFPSAATSRALGEEEVLQVELERHGVPLHIKLNPMLTLLSKKPIEPIADAQEASQLDLPSIYPFLSNLGALEQNIYKPGDHLAFKPTNPFPYVHTAFFSHHIAGSHTHAHPRWNNDRYSGCTVIYNFATALLMARRKFGDDVSGVLPEPITTQTVHITGQEFQFSVFQLNNVNMKDDPENSVKNIFWLTPKLKLFSAIGYESGRERFEGYNPEVFKAFMGMYANGIASE